MGIVSFFASRERSAELRESKDEMVIGEIVRAFAHRGWPALSFLANDDWQRVKFLALDDEVFSAVYITLDRKTGGGIISNAILGSKATLHITAEVKNFLADPDDLLRMVKTDLANLFKISWAGVKVNHEFNAIHGTRKAIIELNKYVNRGPEGIQNLQALLDTELSDIREKLRPYRKTRVEI